MDFALKLDESNTEAVNGAVQDFLNGSTVANALPRNIKARHAIYSNALKTRNIKCVALTQTIYGGITANVATIDDPIDAGTLTLTRIVPERISLPFGADTGLTDGDAT